MKLIAWACAFLFVAASAGAQTLIPGFVKRELWTGATLDQVQAGTQVPTVAPDIRFITSWDAGDVNEGDGYADRMSSDVIVGTGGANGVYDFIISCDNIGVLYFAQDDNPTNKVLIAQQDGWSIAREWNNYRYFDGVVIGPVPGPQKNSATWTNAAGATPWAAGFTLTNGQRYYLEAIRGETGGEDHFAVTIVPHLTAPTDFDATTLTNGLTSYGFTVTVGLLVPTPTNVTFTVNPSNRTAYAGMAAHFTAAVNVQPASGIPPSFQWRRDGVDITNATGPGYTIIASTNDHNAQFSCVVTAPGRGVSVITRTSLVATLTVPASGGLSVLGQLKRELYTGMDAGARTAIGTGNVGVPNSVTAITALDLPTAGNNYGERVNGFFTPPTTDYYAFYVASDNDTDLYVSTNDQPSGKVLVAQEDVTGPARSWFTAGTSTPGQKHSDTWVPDPLNPPPVPPYAGGIHMQAGNRYYIEAVHRGGGGGNHLGATFVTTNEQAAGLPLDGQDTRFTNGVISYVTAPVTTFGFTGPFNTAVVEGQDYTFNVTVTTSSEINPTYQWRRIAGGVTNDIPGATGRSYSGPATLGDNNAQFSVAISIIGVTNAISGTATLTVQAGVFAEGFLKRELWQKAPLGITRPMVEAGLAPPASQVSYITSLDLPGPGAPFADNYVQKISGFFVPPETTNYVFYVATDDDSGLWLSSDDKPVNKLLRCEETPWANAQRD